MTKFTFWAGSLKGLERDYTVYAATFNEAKHYVQKQIYLHRNSVDKKAH